MPTALGKVQGNESHLGAIEQSVRKKAPSQYPDAPKSDARHDGEGSNDEAKIDDVDDQVAGIIFSREESILVPGDVGFVIYRSEKRFGLAV